MSLPRHAAILLVTSSLLLACGSEPASGNPGDPKSSVSSGEPASDGAARSRDGADEGATPAPTPSGPACADIGWCSRYVARGEKPTVAPAFAGGNIAAGTYRLEEGKREALALVFGDGVVVSVSGDGTNMRGTFTTAGNRISVTWTTNCSAEGESPRTDGLKDEYTYHATPSELHLAWLQPDGSVGSLHQRFERRAPAALCEESATFTCAPNTLCGCVVTVGKALPTCE